MLMLHEPEVDHCGRAQGMLLSCSGLMAEHMHVAGCSIVMTLVNIDLHDQREAELACCLSPRYLIEDVEGLVLLKKHHVLERIRLNLIVLRIDVSLRDHPHERLIIVVNKV